MDNPYLPIWNPISLCQAYVLGPELRRQKYRASQWEIGRAARLAGRPCESANGAYLEGWYSVPNPQRGSHD